MDTGLVMGNFQLTSLQLTTWRILAITVVVVGIAAAAGVTAFLLSRSDGVAQVAAPTTVAVTRGDVNVEIVSGLSEGDQVVAQ